MSEPEYKRPTPGVSAEQAASRANMARLLDLVPIPNDIIMSFDEDPAVRARACDQNIIWQAAYSRYVAAVKLHFDTYGENESWEDDEQYILPR